MKSEVSRNDQLIKWFLKLLSGLRFPERYKGRANDLLSFMIREFRAIRQIGNAERTAQLQS
jgi:hypothetical protein